MSDARRLARLVHTDPLGRKNRLHPELYRANGRFCDDKGQMNPRKIRYYYMLAGILSPESDNPEDLMSSIQQNIALLNAYMAHSGLALPTPVLPELPSAPSIRIDAKQTPKAKQALADSPKGKPASAAKAASASKSS